MSNKIESITFLPTDLVAVDYGYATSDLDVSGFWKILLMHFEIEPLDQSEVDFPEAIC